MYSTKLQALGLRVMTSWLTFGVKGMYLFEETLFLVLGNVVAVPFGEAGTTVTADEKEAVDHGLNFVINLNFNNTIGNL